MSDVEFNETINGYRGAIGNLVFRKVKGQTIVSRKVNSRKPPTEAQLRQRANMREAVAFGRLARVDPALREFYRPIAEQKKSSIYQAALQDYLQKASSKLPGPSKDQSCSSEALKLTAPDGAGLDVKIIAQDGTPMEGGKAVEIGVRSGTWTYTLTQPIAEGTVIFIEIN